MRSIGKRNIAKLKQIIKEERQKGIASVDERIMKRVPGEWYEIWESAYDEISRIVDDTLFDMR